VIPLELAEVVNALSHALSGEPFWRRRFDQSLLASGPQVHLAVCSEPFLSLVLEGKKTMETRFGKRRVDPFESVRRNDILVLKRSSGPIAGVALAGVPAFYELDQKSLSSIRSSFERAICPPNAGFWRERSAARYATLIPIEAVIEIPNPFKVEKRDRRGWVVLSKSIGRLADRAESVG
jgi:hypothetical protein